jgi:hypothetical protein
LVRRISRRPIVPPIEGSGWGWNCTRGAKVESNAMWVMSPTSTMPERSAVRVQPPSLKSTLLVVEIVRDAYTPDVRALKERPRHRAAVHHAYLCDSLEALRVNGARREPSGLAATGFGENLDARFICGAT